MTTKKELRSKSSQMEDLYYEIIRDKIEMIKEGLEDRQQIITLTKRVEKLQEEIEKLKESWRWRELEVPVYFIEFYLLCQLAK